MLNKIFIMGRLTRDPELRRTQTGTPVASFSLAVDRDFKDRNTGERTTDFIDCVAWRQTGGRRDAFPDRLQGPVREEHYAQQNFHHGPPDP